MNKYDKLNEIILNHVKGLDEKEIKEIWSWPVQFAQNYIDRANKGNFNSFLHKKVVGTIPATRQMNVVVFKDEC